MGIYGVNPTHWFLTNTLGGEVQYALLTPFIIINRNCIHLSRINELSCYRMDKINWYEQDISLREITSFRRWNDLKCLEVSAFYSSDDR
jgi:hypothetical protein